MAQAAEKGAISLAMGGYIDLLNPDPKDIRIIDIGIGLTNQCRFGGQLSKGFYCPTMDQRVLTLDLNWVAAGDLKVGQHLLGFDEHLTKAEHGKKSRREFRPCIVTHAEPVKRSIRRIELSDGSFVMCSLEHPWLSSLNRNNQKWMDTSEIQNRVESGSKVFMNRFVETWRDPDLSNWEAGWMAGIYDGEGHLSLTGRRGIQMGVSQVKGLVLDKMVQVMRSLGFDNLYYKQTGERKAKQVFSLQQRGGYREIMRLLGTIRPIRLLDKFQSHLLNGLTKQMNGKEILNVVKVWDEGEDWVAGLSTSTKTYLCEGFGAHNSVAQHCVIVSRLVPPQFAFEALLHDAAEAYIGDIQAPLKRLLPDYKKIERGLEDAISSRFGVKFGSPEVKFADQVAFLNEKRDIINNNDYWPGAPNIEISGDTVVYIEPWHRSQALRIFMQRANELMRKFGVK